MPEGQRSEWLNSRHTFSFGEYYDPNNMGFSDLRVINDDIVAPKKGFGLHPHNNMEILSIVLDGALEHKDSMRNVSIINKGEIQKMSAGSGVYHSEFNPSKTNHVHFLQIWILPDKKNIKPAYEQKFFNLEKSPNELILIASKTGIKNSIKINQDVKIYQCLLDLAKTVEFRVHSERKYWIQIAEGAVTINTIRFEAGDGIAITDENNLLQIQSEERKSNFLIFDLR
ncbi:MAG: pirin family protein [Candidatus Gastranaerophilaceae bacterium]